MSRIAWVYLGSVMAAAACIMLATLLTGASALSGMDWATLLILASLATAIQMYKAEGPNHAAFYATVIFLFAGVLLLPLPGIVLLVLLPHLIEWGVTRLWRPGGNHLRYWYIQPFNISMHLLAGAASYWVIMALRGLERRAVVLPEAITMLIAAAVYLVISQLLLGQAFVLARKLSWRATRILTLDNLLSEFLLMCMGGIVAALWRTDPWLVIPGLAPLVMIYRALLIPKLKEEAQTDSKTGLLNARHLHKRVTEELERAQRFGRPFAFIMADLDLLRQINNTYGHLAGDSVLAGIGRIISASVRDYDIAGRFGGEEFAIALPETDRDEALRIAELIRHSIEQATFSVPTVATPIRATMSLGVACFPADAQTLMDLQHEADVAVYQAKFQGRNRVVAADSVPQSTRIEHLQACQAAPAAAPAEGAPAAAEAPAVERPAPAAPPPPPRPESQAPPAAAAQEQRAGAPAESPPPPPRRLLGVGPLVALVVLAGAATTLATGRPAGPIDLVALALFLGLALIAELLQISVYEDNSMSVSLAATIAAALVGGMPAGLVVTTAIVIADQIRQRRPLRDFYKVAFNWGTHVLSIAPLSLALPALELVVQLDRVVELFAVTVAGGLICFLVDSVLISAAISAARGSAIVRTWQTQFRWLSVHYLVLALIGLFIALSYVTMGVLGALVFIIPLFMLRYTQQQYVSRTRESVRELRRVISELSDANEGIRAAHSALRSANGELLHMLGRVLDMRDPYTSGHSIRVSNYAGLLAEELGMPPDQQQLLREAGLLHDIGKIAISETILSKPSKLTAEEYAQIKLHASIGADLLASSQGLQHIAPLVRYHHERWDGQGYPDGLGGEEIPLGARILAICDSVEAMTAGRPYQPGMSISAALVEVERCAGRQFDPQLAAAFVEAVRRSELRVASEATALAPHPRGPADLLARVPAL